MSINLMEPATKLDPRVKRTRNVLLQAFKELLSEGDLADITVQDIAERAEVNRATFYVHFSDKFTLMDYLIRTELQDALEQHMPDVNSFTLMNLRMLAVTVNEFVSVMMSYCRSRVSREDQMRIIGAQVQLHIYELIVGWLKETDLDNGSAANRAMTLSWVIFGTAFQSALSHGKLPPEQLADQTMAFLAPSLESLIAQSAV